MDIFILILKIIFGLFFCYSGFAHFKKPDFFNGFIPDFLPKKLVNYVFGAIEIILGIGLFFNQTTTNAAFALLILMLLFLPIHIWDLLKEKPAIGSKKMGIIRIIVQFVLLFLLYLIYSKY